MKKLFIATAMFLAACGGSQSGEFQYGSYKMTGSSAEFPIIVNFAPDGKFSGKIVNNMMGNYSLGQNNQISFEPIATTMMMGPEEAMNAEQKFLQTIPEITSYKNENGKLLLQTTDGQILEFEPSKQ